MNFRGAGAWFRPVPFVLAVVAAGLLLCAGSGTRFGVWPYQTGFAVMRWSAYVGLAAGALALIALGVPKLRGRAAAGLAVALVAGIGVAWVPWEFLRRAQSVPPIHDISTDLENPPLFVAILPLRAGASNTAAHGGKEIAEQQRKGYPEIRPLMLVAPPADAFATARAAAEGMGWEIVAADAAAGRIEATATTPWFGFKDDIVIRIVPAGAGSRLDMRSVSRVGRNDIGVNARRIREYFARLAA